MQRTFLPSHGLLLDEDYDQRVRLGPQDADAPPDPVEDVDDADTVYSDVSSLIDSKVDSYASALAEDIVKRLKAEDLDSAAAEILSSALPELLRAFATKLGYDAPSQTHRDVMFFIHKYRK